MSFQTLSLESKQTFTLPWDFNPITICRYFLLHKSAVMSKCYIFWLKKIWITPFQAFFKSCVRFQAIFHITCTTFFRLFKYIMCKISGNVLRFQTFFMSHVISGIFVHQMIFQLFLTLHMWDFSIFLHDMKHFCHFCNLRFQALSMSHKISGICNICKISGIFLHHMKYFRHFLSYVKISAFFYITWNISGIFCHMYNFRHFFF